MKSRFIHFFYIIDFSRSDFTRNYQTVSRGIQSTHIPMHWFTQKFIKWRETWRDKHLPSTTWSRFPEKNSQTIVLLTNSTVYELTVFDLVTPYRLEENKYNIVIIIYIIIFIVVLSILIFVLILLKLLLLSL